MHRIAILIPYFGNVPWYLKFFNKSCCYNPDVDFILLTDMDLSGDLAKNITVFKSSLAEISKRCTEKLGFEINIGRPYKLCDLRPAFGLVFSDLVEGYDFWGYGDIDLILGNIRSLITAEILDKHDIVSIREEYITGCFSLFKNNEKINNLFKRSKDYKRAFQEPMDYCFDECNWEWRLLRNGKDISELDSLIDSITHVVRRAERAGDISVYWHSMEVHPGLPGTIVWDRGNLSCKDHKAPLLCHFNFFKHWDIKLPKWETIPERFYMSSFYFSRHAPGSLTGRLLHCYLTTARWLKRKWNIMNQYLQWAISYLSASRTIDLKDKQLAGLPGIYRYEKVVVSVSVIDHCLHGKVECLYGAPVNIGFRLLHKKAGKFVVVKCKFLELLNVELDFHLSEYISTHTMLLTADGNSKRYTFFKITN